ncbi:MAG: hypothetical protein M0Q48_10925 [Verrucomicrobia bacterium]|jgi:exopolyphosphatase/guanosine-5'-triphosphate,3'-diphosphate pyrophosphatase|nr:hypothetical protein [Verrucomicrobiota bacterium]
MPARAHIRKPAEKRAAIDIGSNSVKLLIARVKDRCVSPIVEKSTQTRLNKGLREGGDFNSASIRSTLRVLRGYVELCIQHQTLPPLLFATSAARNASLKSLQNLLQPLWKEFGLSIQVISPLQEAKWAFRGVCSERDLQDTPVLLTDVGGGSAQFIIGKKGKLIWSKSRQLGAVHLLESFSVSDPPTFKEKSELLAHVRKAVSELRSEIEADEIIRKAIPDFSFESLRWIGAGGAATILASMHLGLSRFNSAKLEGCCLSSADIQKWADRIWSLTLSDRKSLPGLPSGRADITLSGAAVYLAVMQVFAFSELTISTRGGRHGALLSSMPSDSADRIWLASEDKVLN